MIKNVQKKMLKMSPKKMYLICPQNISTLSMISSLVLRPEVWDSCVKYCGPEYVTQVYALEILGRKISGRSKKMKSLQDMF